MANLSHPIQLSFPGETTPRVQKNFHRAFTTDIGLTYFHVKTSLQRYSNAMFMIEAEGYNYGRQQPIKCSWCGYLYDLQASPLISTGASSPYDGMTAHGLYLSSDNYLVLRGFASEFYFAGFNLSAFQMNPTNAYPVTALTSAFNNNSGNFY